MGVLPQLRPCRTARAGGCDVDQVARAGVYKPTAPLAGKIPVATTWEIDGGRQVQRQVVAGGTVIRVPGRGGPGVGGTERRNVGLGFDSTGLEGGEFQIRLPRTRISHNSFLIGRGVRDWLRAFAASAGLNFRMNWSFRLPAWEPQHWKPGIAE